MNITTITSGEFNRDVGKAKLAAMQGPVFITDRGHAVHVLLTVEDYQRISERGKSIVELLAMPAAEEIEFDPPRITSDLYRPAELS